MDTPKFIETTDSQIGVKHVNKRYFKTEDGRWKLLVTDYTPDNANADVMKLLMDVVSNQDFDIPGMMTRDFGKRDYVLSALNEKDGKYHLAQIVDSFREIVEYFKRDS